MRLSSPRKKKTLINITSLIDVLFLLLIFIMISSTFMEEPGMKLDLPKAESAEIGEKKETTVYITEEGEIFLNSERVTLDELRERLQERLSELSETGLSLKADAAATHGLVVEVMDVARQVGVKKLVVATQPKKGG